MGATPSPINAYSYHEVVRHKPIRGALPAHPCAGRSLLAISHPTRDPSALAQLLNASLRDNMLKIVNLNNEWPHAIAFFLGVNGDSF